ncbi:MAG: uracil-DNA glycosylase family protein, partial [Candidatus Paceibacteria bacterium]
MNSCNNCPYPTNTCGPGGPTDTDLMIVGVAPGKEEIIQGSPFIGRSGKLLNHVLNYNGINRGDCYITNSIKCRVPDNNSPSDEALEACHDRLEVELNNTVDPNVILSLGAVASKQILDTDKGINELRGYVYERDGRYVIPSFHPAQCLRVKETFKDFQFDIKKAIDCLRNGYSYPDVDPNYSVVESCVELQQACDWMNDNFEIVSCDIETTGLDWKRCDLLAIGFGVDDNRAVIIDWRTIDNTEKARKIL